MAEAGVEDEWTTIAKKPVKKKSKQEEWTEVPGKKERRKKESTGAPPAPSPAPQGAQGGGRGRGGERGGGRGRGEGRGRGGGNTLPRKDSRQGGKLPPAGGTLPRGGGYSARGNHTPSPGPGARSVTPSSSTPARSTPPPPAPVLQGAWAAKAGSQGSTPQGTPPPSAVTTPPPPRKASVWGNVAKVEEVEVKETPAPPSKEDASANEDVVAKIEVCSDETAKKSKPVEAKTESSMNESVVKELIVDVKIEAVKVEETVDVVAEPEVVSSEVLNEDKLVMKETMVIPPGESIKKQDTVEEEAKTEPQEKTVLEEEKKDENKPVIGKEEAVVADSNGNFPTDANENINSLGKEIAKDVPGDKVVEINSNDVDMKEAPEKTAPLTNGVSKEEEADLEKKEEEADLEKEPKALPYTPEQWSPLNPEGKKQYERDFLLQLQKNPLSLQKPAEMPTNMEIILPEMDILRQVASAPDLGGFTPMLAGRNSSRGTPGRNASRQGAKSSAAARLGVKVINLTREEVKLNETENRWMPGVKVAAKEGEKVEVEDEVEVLAKRVRSILNKLCPQKFDTLVTQFQELPIDDRPKLMKAMELVFEKALDEPVFSVAYAKMCKALSMKKIADEDGKEVVFRNLLINRCQMEFQKDYMADLDRTAYVANLAKATTDEERKLITAQFNQQETKLRRRSLGNIKFIGELYRIQMLTGRIMHACIQKLLGETDEESLECMCRLITTIGQLLDQETQKVLATPKSVGFASLDMYFTNIRQMIEKKVCTARIRFLMQDLLDLRQAAWVSRREESGPKLISEVHKDAAMDAIKKTLGVDSGPPPSRRSEDRSDRRKSQARPPPKDRQQTGQDGWNNVPDRPARISQGKIDVNKLPKLSMNANSLQLGPPGGMRPNWGRGSAQMQQKKTSVQVQPTNRFAMFNDDDEGGMPPPQPQYHGRASEPAIRTYSGTGSREGSHSREGSQGREGREGSYTGRHSHREGGTNRETVPESEAVSNLRGSADTEPAVLEQKTKAILEEYFGLKDTAEAYLCLTELYHAKTISSFVENMFNCVVERSSGDRLAAGWLVSHLLEKDSLPLSQLLNGLNTILEVAEDLAIDIPKFWLYLAEILAPCLLSSAAPLTLLRDSSLPLAAHLSERYVAAVLGAMVRTDEAAAVTAWTRSGLAVKDLGVAQPQEFCTSHSLGCLVAHVGSSLVPPAMLALSSLLTDLAAGTSGPALNTVFDHITENFTDTTDTVFIRDLVSTVIKACLDGLDTMVTLDQKKLTLLAGVLKPYLDAQKEREVWALYALQALVHRLEHPNKLLHSIFDVLYEVELISEDAFMEWEESTETGEQEGKGVALKSCTQFFQWLKTAEPEDEPEEQQKAVFSIGDGEAGGEEAPEEAPEEAAAPPAVAE